jgi:hypothetical protein
MKTQGVAGRYQTPDEIWVFAQSARPKEKNVGGTAAKADKKIFLTITSSSRMDSNTKRPELPRPEAPRLSGLRDLSAVSIESCGELCAVAFVVA